MAHVFADRVMEASTSTGAGAFVLSGAVLGFQAFSAVCAVNDTVPYYIEAVDNSGRPTGAWELGLGTYSAANQLTRTTVRASSNGNAAVNFAAGTKIVGLGVPAPASAAARAEWRNALGMTAVGQSVALAADQAAARAAIGAASTDASSLTSGTLAIARMAAGTIIGTSYAETTSYAALTAQIPGDDTIPQSTEGTQVLAVSHTPKSVTSRLRARAVIWGTPSAGTGIVGAMFRNAATDASQVTYTSNAGAAVQQLVLQDEWVPGSTSPQTISIRVGPDSAVTFNLLGASGSRRFGGAAKCTLTVEEIQA